MQLVFDRNPEIPGDLLRDNPDLMSSSFLHDRGGGQAAEVLTTARNEISAAMRKAECQESAGHQTTGGTNFPTRRHGCSDAC